eukprot:1196404-Prorocentrum_minimum.AAC.3
MKRRLEGCVAGEGRLVTETRWLSSGGDENERKAWRMCGWEGQRRYVNSWPRELWVLVYHRNMRPYFHSLYLVTRLGIPVLIGLILASFFYSQVLARTSQLRRRHIMYTLRILWRGVECTLAVIGTGGPVK